MEFDATFDNAKNPIFRYSLTRIWDRRLKKATIIMLNPSIANVLKNDLSINRCLNFCIDKNYGSIEVVNLFAYIETDSKKLSAKPEFIGIENDFYLQTAVKSADTIIVAWGSDKEYRTRKKEVWNRFLNNRMVYYFEDNSSRTPPVHTSRLANGIYLKEFSPTF
ncbi:DUF1643 domain-containing protein [Alkalihalobacillus sp. AL-G]|uniref:DUF1643 domain-containing protein n=1 Tax=Alkalihalobacillus sp. AL-G TaxID=2926399 RepID=UPI00272C011B|nr:DUF1643 domain-containing protein [Alkalihalobacillus sp. AL-G]WLD92315.1 DUF1643 domain-containing protein [Alkalihalobacillus sp. AL-G]